MDYEEKVHLILLGESNSGKTSLSHKYANGFFTNQSIPTIGIEYVTKKLCIEDRNYRVKIWDTAGQERYKSMTKNFYRNADGVILVYDITERESFDKIRSWVQSVKENVDDIKMILVGNKVDLADERAVRKEEGEKLASFYNVPFFETSAKEDVNVDNAFGKIIDEVIEVLKKNKKEEPILIDYPKRGFFPCCGYN